MKKIHFFATEIECLGFWLAREGVKPMQNKVATIDTINIPKTVKYVRCVIGMVTFYREIWQHISHMFVPLTRLTSIKNEK